MEKFFFFLCFLKQNSNRQLSVTIEIQLLFFFFFGRFQACYGKLGSLPRLILLPAAYLLWLASYGQLEPFHI